MALEKVNGLKNGDTETVMAIILGEIAVSMSEKKSKYLFLGVQIHG